MHPRSLEIRDFTYDLPDERIARYPLEERDASRLVVYQSGTISEDTYKNIATHIPEGTLLIFNQTKVVHARLLFKKDTGGTIEVFCLEPHEQYTDLQTAMLQRGKVWWKCMIGGASKWKHGLVLTQEFTEFTLSASIIERETGSFTLELSWDREDMSFAEVLHIAGKVPLPPYLHREAEMPDEERYQTIYAKEEGSVAAPTAGLHFTDTVMQTLVAKGAHINFVTLHVGAGTFKPVKAETMALHEMHAEWIDVPVTVIQQVVSHLDKGVIAVGTTSLRTLESLYWIGCRLLRQSAPDLAHVAVSQWEPYETNGNDISARHALQAIVDWMLQNHLQRLVTRTRILIAPGYTFKVIKGLITNFHQPQSTLLLLVAALVGEDWRNVYDYALNNGFRFLSYGDGSLLWANVNKSLPSR